MTREELTEALGDHLSNLLLEERRLGRLAAIQETIAFLTGLLDEAPDQEAPVTVERQPGDGLH